MIMSSSNGKRDMRTVWGYTFEWTPEHLTKEQMRPMTHSYDTLASEVLDRLDQLSPPSTNMTPPAPEKETQQEDSKDEGQHEQDHVDENENIVSREANTASDEKTSSQDTPAQPPKPKAARRDLYALILEHHESDPVISDFYNQLHDIPSWVDWDQIARGQAVFYRYGGPAIVALTFQSLVGGMASTRITQTLTRTGGFHVSTAKHRLLETFQHVLQVTASPASIQPSCPAGAGFAASIRVRLLHAHVRRRILSLSRENSRYFDVADWGVPINDLDCLGTVLSFSAALLWIGLPRQGIWVTEREREDYTALWRWVGHLLGTPTPATTTGGVEARDWLADWRSAKVLFESLIVAELDAPSVDEGGVLANNILTALSAQPPAFASREFMCAEARWLNGGALCDALGIARVSAWYGVLVAVQCGYFMGFCYLKRLVPAWDERNRERVRKILYKLTVENKEIGLGQETIFDFKHVPQFSLLKTPLGDMSGGKQIGRSERRSLVTLAVVTVLAGTAAWFGCRSMLRTGVFW